MRRTRTVFAGILLALVAFVLLLGWHSAHAAHAKNVKDSQPFVRSPPLSSRHSQETKARP